MPCGCSCDAEACGQELKGEGNMKNGNVVAAAATAVKNKREDGVG